MEFEKDVEDPVNSRIFSNFYSVNDFRLHFGLGAAENVDLEIRRPNGGKETIFQIAANRLVTVQEGEGVVRTEEFHRRG
jgi:hypothetical protein